MVLRRVLVLLALTSLLAACAGMPKLKFLQAAYDFPNKDLEVRELRRALLCGTPTQDPVVRLFDSYAELTAWDANDSLQLARVNLPQDRAYVLLEQGLRRTSGYSIELDKTAKVNEQGILSLQADWLEPGPDRMVAQMLTSLCVLAAVEPMPYLRVEVRDSTGAIKVSAEPLRD